MRAVILLDNKIDKDEALALLADYGDWYESQTSIPCTFWLERKDFSSVPTVADSDGDLKPTYKYRQDVATDVHSRYGDYGADNLILWVHDDNFLFKGVWGTAWSYEHYKYNLLLCRWDKKNPVNTWNTLFHEGEHPANTTIKKELGIDINPLIAEHFKEPNFDYDKDYVHGNSPQFKYIGERGYIRDGRMLKFLAPYIKQALEKRLSKHLAQTNLQRRVISLAQHVVQLLKKRLYMKDGVSLG